MLLNLVPSMIMGKDNKILKEVSDMEKVRRMLFAMDRESAAGPNGFTRKFFTFSWYIIVQDIHKAVVSFFCGTKLPRFTTSIYYIHYHCANS